MTTQNEAERLDIFEITHQAQRMRSAYTAEAIGRFGRWIATRFSAAPMRAGRTA